MKQLSPKEIPIPPLEVVLKKLDTMQVNSLGWYHDNPGTSASFSSEFYLRQGDVLKYGFGGFSKARHWVGSWENGTEEESTFARYWIIDKSKKRYATIEYMLSPPDYTSISKAAPKTGSVFLATSLQDVHKYLSKVSNDAMPALDSFLKNYRLVTKDAAAI